MRLDRPYYDTIEVPDTDKIELKLYSGKKYLVLNNTDFIEFNQSNFNDFCKKTKYHQVIDMYPETIYLESIHSEEAYLAYMYSSEGKWQNVVKLEAYITGLQDLVNFIKFG